MIDHNSEIGHLRLTGEVGSYFEDGIAADAVYQALDAMNGQDLTVQLRSDGGDVFEGLAIYNALNHYPGKVTITIDALAASIASVIAMAGDDVAIYKGSMMMVHNPWTIAAGDAREFRGIAEILDKIGGEIAGIYDSKSGGGAAHFLELMAHDHYLTAEEALEEGLVDRIVTSAPVVSEPLAALRSVAVAAGFPRRSLAERRLRLASRR